MAAKIAVRHDETAGRGRPGHRRGRGPHPRGGADRPGHLPGARHRPGTAGLDRGTRPPPDTAGRAAVDRGAAREPDPARTPGGRTPRSPRLQGRPAPDRRAGGGAVDGRAPGRPVPCWPVGGTVRWRRDRRRPGRPARRRVVARFGARLPFLLKVLAAAQPLSLQAHPTLAQAGQVRGEEARRRPPRNYVDACHKPEMLVALTDFDALCGFRDPAVAAPAAGRARRAGAGAGRRGAARGDRRAALRDAVRGLLGRPDRAGLVDEVVAAGRRAPRRQPYADLGSRSSSAGATRATSAWWWRCCSTRSRLAPGEAVWMPAGNLHALPARRRRGDHGGQRQRAARRPDPEARRRRRAAAGAALRGARPTRWSPPRSWRPVW